MSTMECVEGHGTHPPDRDRVVASLDGVGREERHEAFSRSPGLRDDHDAARVLVQPVNDAGSERVTGLVTEFGVMKERVDEGPRRMTHRRVDNHASGLVDDEEMVVLKAHIDGEVCPLRRAYRRRSGDDV